MIYSSGLNAHQLASYDHGKHFLLGRFPAVFKDNMLTHFCASFFAGFCTAATSNPIDVVRTRIMNETVAAGQRARYTNPISSVVMIVRAEGMAGLYKGFVPSYIRLGSATVMFLMLYEQLRRLCNLPTM